MNECELTGGRGVGKPRRPREARVLKEIRRDANDADETTPFLAALPGLDGAKRDAMQSSRVQGYFFVGGGPGATGGDMSNPQACIRAFPRYRRALRFAIAFSRRSFGSRSPASRISFMSDS